MRVHNRYPDPSVAILFMALLFYHQQELAKTQLWDLNQNQNAVFSFNTFHSGSMPPCVKSRAYAMKTSSRSCTMKIHTAGLQLRMGPAPSWRFY